MNGVQILMMNQEDIGLGFGYLYNGYAIQHANFAPTGWHVPTYSNYTTLSTYLGGDSVSGGKLKEVGTTKWNTPNTGATNSSGFTAFGSGSRQTAGGFFDFKEISYYPAYTLSCMRILYNSAAVGFYGLGEPYMAGYPVRLMKDSTTLSDGETSTMTDEDGNVYDTICIGTQEWTVQNWKCTKLNDGTALTKVTSNTTWAAAGTGDYYYCAYDNDENNV